MLLRQSVQAGASLIEVMVALFVMAIGLLGFAALLTTSSTLNQRAFQLSQAVFLAESIVERARANRDSVSNYGITLAQNATSSGNCDSADCDAATMASWDLAQWMTQVEGTLPEGDAEITIDTTTTIPIMTVTVYYELREGGKSTGDSALLGTLENHTLRAEI